MHSALNYRHSRRSACDRCRGFKLRCERDHLNNMSCERCLKAQVVCTTSRTCPAGDMDNDQAPFSALHRVPNAKVSKTTFPSTAPCRQDRPLYDGWNQPSLMPFFAMDELPQSAEYIALEMPPHDMPLLPSQNWDDRGFSWSPGIYQLPPTDYCLPEFPYELEGKPINPRVQTLNSQTGLESQSTIIPQLSSQDHQFNNTAGELLLRLDKNWDISGDTTGERIHTAIQDGDGLNSQDLRKNLLRMNMELVDDLDLLKADSELLASSSLMETSPRFSTGNLDLPIYRMLAHSTRFLEVLQSLISPADQQTGSASVPRPIKVVFNPVIEEEHTTFFADIDNTVLDDGAATTSSHDSGYQTATGLSPEDQSIGVPAYNLDSTTSMSIVMTYVYLLRVYRAVFTRLYQLFLIIPPSDAAAFLMLPNLQFGQFQMKGNLAVQVQVLIELSSSMLGKIDIALGLSSISPQNQEGPDANQVGPVLEDRSFLAIRDIVLAQEKTPCEMSLKELMRCLRQVVKDPVSI